MNKTLEEMDSEELIYQILIENYYYLFLIIILIILLIIFIYHYYHNFMYVSIDSSAFNNMDKYYINLDKSEDRKKNIEKILLNQNLYVKRFPAINGKLLNIEDPKYHKMIHKIKWWFLKNEKKILDILGVI